MPHVCDAQFHSHFVDYACFNKAGLQHTNVNMSVDVDLIMALDKTHMITKEIINYPKMLQKYSMMAAIGLQPNTYTIQLSRIFCHCHPKPFFAKTSVDLTH